MEEGGDKKHIFLLGLRHFFHAFYTLRLLLKSWNASSKSRSTGYKIKLTFSVSTIDWKIDFGNYAECNVLCLHVSRGWIEDFHLYRIITDLWGGVHLHTFMLNCHPHQRGSCNPNALLWYLQCELGLASMPGWPLFTAMSIFGLVLVQAFISSTYYIALT